MLEIKRGLLPEYFQQFLNEKHIDGSRAMQADQSEEETEYLIDLPASN